MQPRRASLIPSLTLTIPCSNIWYGNMVLVTAVYEFLKLIIIGKFVEHNVFHELPPTGNVRGVRFPTLRPAEDRTQNMRNIRGANTGFKGDRSPSSVYVMVSRLLLSLENLPSSTLTAYIIQLSFEKGRPIFLIGQKMSWAVWLLGKHPNTKFKTAIYMIQLSSTEEGLSCHSDSRCLE